MKKILTSHKESFIRFCIVGALATIFNYSIFFIFYKLFSINYLLSSGTGYVSGIFISYNLNKNYTFKVDKSNYQVIKYFSVFIGSLCLGLLFLHFQVQFINLDPLVANVFMIGFTTITNYLGTKYFVFKK